MTREERYKAQTKPDPEKYCTYCGKRMKRVRFKSGRLEDLSAFQRRKYCCWDCFSNAQIKSGYNEQDYRPAHQSAFRLAYKVLKLEKRCQICGAENNIDVHHKDGNYKNNSLDNLMILCRKCHIKIHRYGKEVSY